MNGRGPDGLNAQADVTGRSLKELPGRQAPVSLPPGLDACEASIVLTCLWETEYSFLFGETSYPVFLSISNQAGVSKFIQSF